jgi:hypothetical protein
MFHALDIVDSDGARGESCRRNQKKRGQRRRLYELHRFSPLRANSKRREARV